MNPADDPVGAFVHRWPNAVSGPEAGDGPLAGLRLAVDDLIDVEGLTTGAGNPDWRRTHAAATASAPALVRLLAAGADLVGTTVVDELGYGVIGVNPHGTPINPATPDSVPGGAAAGAAAAVGAVLADLALVCDTLGGARIPAGLCGLYGFRPTADRVPRDGIVGRAPSFDAVGLLARDTTVLWAAALALLGAPGPDAMRERRFRIALADDVWAAADDEVNEAMLPELQRLAVRFPFDHIDQLAVGGLDAWSTTERELVGFETWRTHGPWLEAVNPTLALDLKQRLDTDRTISPPQADDARRHREAIVARLAEVLVGDTVLAVPTTPEIAPLVDSSDAQFEAFRRRAGWLTCLAGLGGLPQVTVPLVQLAEYPVGLSLIGAAGTDEALIAVAATIARPV